MTTRRVPVAGPWVTEREVEYTADAARNGWYEHAGDYPGRFEAAFARAVGRGSAVSLPSATSGLHLALAAAGIGPGDEVIVPTLTWIASCAPVTYVGADIVAVDVDPTTWCLTVDAVADALTPRTRAIIAVDLYGSMPDLPALERFARSHDLLLVEDAAESLGSAFGDRPAGSFGDLSVFSFHGSKTLTTGEGGMLVGDTEALIDRVKVLRDHGRAPGDRYFANEEVAYKYKMSALQAAFGLAQLERIDELVDRKRRIFGWYRERLAGDRRVTLNAEPDGTRNSYWMSTVVLADEVPLDNLGLMAAFDRAGIDSRPMFRPLHRLPAFAGSAMAIAASRRTPVAERLDGRGLNLPSALMLDEGDVDRVTDVLRATLDDVGPSA